MNLRRAWMLPILLLLVGGLADCQRKSRPTRKTPNPRVNVRFATLDPVVIAAWEEAGAIFGRLRVKGAHGLVWGQNIEGQKLEFEAGDMPGFRFHSGSLRQSLERLPQPSVPFCLAFEDLTDAELKKLARMKQLHALHHYGQGGHVTDAGLKELAELTHLLWLDFEYAEVTNAGMKEIGRLTQLDTLCLVGAQVTDAGLKELAGLKQLRILWLGGTKVTDVGLKELAGLTQLQSLDIGGMEVTDAGVRELARLEQLRHLNLYGPIVTDTGVKELARLEHLSWLGVHGFFHAHSLEVTGTGFRELTDLQSLHLEHTGVTDTGLKELAGLTQLQELYLGNTQVTDVGLKELKRLAQLQSLSLDETQVTDAGLKELARLRQLQSLSLSKTQVTDVGLKELAHLTQLRSLSLFQHPGDICRCEGTQGGIAKVYCESLSVAVYGVIVSETRGA